MSRRHLPVVASLAVLTLLGTAMPAASGTETRAGVPLDQLTATATEVATGLRNPTAITALNDGSGRIAVTEKRGVVRAYHPRTGLAAEPLLDISDKVNAADVERGLLGLAIATDRQVYVAYTRKSDNAVTLGRTRFGSNQVQELLSQEHSRYPNHNGGQLAFGPDGKLYWGIGDGGGAGDPLATGQKLDTLLGKILRIDVSRACAPLPYCVPADNPFVRTPGARPEIWSYGLRNPWQFSFDRADRSLWIGDVGQGRFEEVDHIGGNQGGVNFGWSCKEGPVVYDETRCSPDAKYTDPVFHYISGEQGCAVIGGYVYRGRKFAGLAAGTYLATDFCRGTAWAVRKNADGTYASGQIGQFPLDATAFGTDAQGELYLADEVPGRLHRISFAKKG
ncbi:PQQ-dependent sugar dehydrogenase [Amycolatopsis suaedae]|uniref:Glucose/sorbosone dehydrogenase-like protein n=1 Tax=Amycolatopsis suaedae TaxID=2510978 RepID=A0A4Q7JE71_9PSEU|nr:PQQ-dependent sugar dehydrogenase [Amycolatopsis suaedae]RZQ65779.1 glucose/sorbosone dehydrogenase-like protein [Amycolatopsis suaedae]